MSKVVAIVHLTLDGVMQGPGRPDEDRRDGFEKGGWAAAGDDPSMQKVIGASMGPAWTLLVGRVTYEDLASHWPGQPRPNPMAEALDRVEKFVVSTTLSEPLAWQNSFLLKGDIASAVAGLKRNREKTLVIFGSGVLVQFLSHHGLIDEYVFPVHPLVLGSGRRLFPDGGHSMHLKLIESVPCSSGVTISTYRPAI